MPNLSAKQRTVIGRRAANKAWRTMRSKGYLRAKKHGRRAIVAYLAKKAA